MREKIACGRWFETTVSYVKEIESGVCKVVKELYTIEAYDFGTAEKQIEKELCEENQDETSWQVLTIVPAAYGSVLFSDDTTEEKWFKAKVAFSIVDETTGNEKKRTGTFLVQGRSIDTARKNVEDALRYLSVEWTVTAIVETKILDVFENRK